MKNVKSKIIIVSVIIVGIIIALVIINNNRPLYKSTYEKITDNQYYGYTIYANGTIKEFNRNADGKNLKKSKISEDELKKLKKLIKDLQKRYEKINKEDIYILNSEKIERRAYKNFDFKGIMTSTGDECNNNSYAKEIDKLAFELYEKYLDIEKDNFITNGEYTIKKNNTIQINKSLLSQITVKNYGDTVNYRVEANGKVFDNWKIFYSDNNKVYIIYGDYISTSALDLNKIKAQKVGEYNILWDYNETANQVVNYLTYEKNWSHLITKELREKGVTAIGSPTLNMFVQSWNAKGYLKLYPKFYTIGYSIGGTDGIIDVTKDKGYLDSLYYPHREIVDYNKLIIRDECSGYFLATAEAGKDEEEIGKTYNLICIECDGTIISTGVFGEYKTGTGLRPVICLTNSVLGIQEKDGSWTIK